MTQEYKPAQQIIIAPDRSGQRLDNFLFAQFRQLPKSRIYKMLRKGEVRINGGRVKQAYRIQSGDRLRLPPVRIDSAAQSKRPIPDGALELMEKSILFEDADLLVLSKPAGLAVHAGSGVRYGVIEILRKLRPNDQYLELAHRLDRGRIIYSWARRVYNPTSIHHNKHLSILQLIESMSILHYP